MNKEKQIEEIAKSLCHLSCACEECVYLKYRTHVDKCKARVYAERAYKAGYRKQSEGEWIIKGEYLKILQCSACDYTADTIYAKTTFCPNCGAKMKGGE